MKLTFVMGFFLPVPALQGGATEKIWLRLGELMAGRGHEITIVSRRWPGLPDCEQCAGVTHLRLPGWNHTRSLPRNLWLDLRWGHRVRDLLPEADLVVCHTVTLPLHLRRRRPEAGKVAVALGRMPKGQVRFYTGVDLLLATSEAVAEAARRECRSGANRVILFPHPIDWHAHHAAADQSLPPAPIEIGYVGRIHPEKGLENLLEAGVRLRRLANLPDWRLTLLGPVSIPQGGGGESYQRTLLERYRPELGDRLRFLPPEFDAHALAAAYGRFHIFCYPSRAARGEGLSIAPLEAMAAGAAPVVSQLDCYRDMIRPGETGLTFDQESPRAPDLLAGALQRLIIDGDLRRGIAAKAQREARRYDYAMAADLLLGQFARLTGKPAQT